MTETLKLYLLVFLCNICKKHVIKLTSTNKNRIDLICSRGRRFEPNRVLFLFRTDTGPVVESPISTNPGLTFNKTDRVRSGLAVIGL